MKRTSTVILSLAACLSMSTSLLAVDPVKFEVFAAYAPNGRAPNAAPSWDDYVLNAVGALELGSPNVGDREVDPTAYETVTGTVSPLDMFYTNFNSWRGQADPNPSFYLLNSDLRAETGNRIHFGLHAKSNGTLEFALQDLSFKLDSNDATNWFDQQGDFSGANYSNTRVGINYGPDGQKGTPDDLVYDNGQSGALGVHELMYVGIGDGFYAAAADGANNQDAIAENVRDLLATCANCVFDVAGIYTLANPAGGQPLIASDTVTVSIPAGIGGDFNFDRNISAADKDLLTKAIVAGGNDILYDLNVDGLVNLTDLEIMVQDIANTYFGDANCDGEFNSTDLIDVFQAGLYETGNPAMWSTGDFNADGVFGSGDLVVAFIDGGYELGPRAAVAAVPEPTSLVLTLVGLALVAVRSRRR